MALSSDLISQFVQVTKEEKTNKETTVYGTIVEYDGGKYVQLDGSELLTPISTTVDALDGERVTVMIKNHSALVTGNITSPSARTDTVKEIGNSVNEIGTKISEFEIVIADKVSTERLEAEIARIDTLVSENVTIKGRLDANEADINTLSADNVSINEKLTAAEADIDSLNTTKLDAEVAEITYATVGSLQATDAKINNLESTYGEFEQLATNKFTAIEAEIKDLDVGGLTAEEADIRYANIDFTNIGGAAIENFFSKSGMIDDLVVGEGTITGTLVGVTIKGDLIEGGTVKADKLVIKGSDGLYYKLNTEGGATTSEQVTEEDLQNGLSGSIIVAKSITAEKVAVDDLVAFDATIGGFHITDNSLYSGVKETVDNTTTGIYLDSEGQVAFGDGTNYLKYYKLEDGTYKLDISAASIVMSATNTSVETYVSEATDAIREEMMDQNTTIIDTTTDMILSALEPYVPSSNYEEFRQTVEAQLAVMADEIAMNFTTTTEQIENVDGDLQSKFTELYKHITFSNDGITISAGENAMSIRVDNDIVIFEKGGTQFGWWDGIDFHTGNIMIEVTERAQFGNFAFVPRTDGSLSFLKVEHNSGFYASLRGGIMSVYGAYPTLDETTMIISDISGVLNETTLILGGG